MGPIKAIANGLGTTVRKSRLLVILYPVNLAFAAAVAVPFLAIFQSELGHSFLGSTVRPLDVTWLGEALLKYGDVVPAILGQVLIAALLYLVLHIFLNGGIVGRLLDREGRITLASFFADCGRYFWKYVRLFLVSLVFYVLTLGVFLRLVSELIAPLDKAAVTQWLPLILSNLHFLVALLLLSIVHMIIDYARIAVVADEEARIRRALRHAFIFLKNRFFRAWGLYLLIVALTVAGTAVFYAVLRPLDTPGAPLVVAGFLWMQIYVLFRIWMRILFVAAQAEFYRSQPY